MISVYKKLLLILSFIFISFAANAKSTVSVDFLYKMCKPLQSDGFDTKNQSQIKKVRGLVCTTFFRTLADAGFINCVTMKNLYKEKMIPPNDIEFISRLSANKIANVNAVITSFIRLTENNPDKFNKLAVTFKAEYLHQVFPCEYNSQ
tara:strand:+ start:683 stop:1126 length:444 start_codon:yes stop_codon:yes gene_type:complete